MNKQVLYSILIIIIVVCTLGIIYQAYTIEGLTNAEIYAAAAQQNAKNKGFSGGFAGSGKTVSDVCYNDMHYLNAPTEASFNEVSKYKLNDPNVQYHQSAAELTAANYDQGGDVSFGLMWVIDASGNKVGVPYSPVQGNITYYTPGAYLFGASTYVPSYEDSVYLSSTTGKTYLDPTNAAVYRNVSAIAGGACAAYKDNPLLLEQACQTMNTDTCASTSCCVLLGGSKCVSGNERGPSRHENYGDVYVKNKDFYYYQGKCYGNCPNSS
jgi:hypothetical protein